MEKVILAQNFALMFEMMRAKGYNHTTIVALLEEKKEELLESIGEGIPSWGTMIDFYHKNKSKFYQAIKEGYEIAFLTKGALKSLLSIKFEMKEGEEFFDTGESLEQVKITKDNLQTLRDMISKNWTILALEENIDDPDVQLINIELTHKPVTK
ncbi:hypothetical protein ACQKP0_01610 [Heyndrickxia sp. NPDC080065]|uniref:hypothetical protein n=1 Tax=Heyndrickxia sp. NPDC080065 TaxID=3390568 RepID=UPI003D00355D